MAHINESYIIPAPIKETFDLLTNPLKLPHLLKGKIDVEIQNGAKELNSGAEFVFLMTRLGISQYVRFRIDDLSRGNWLTYRQVEGLFRKWVHTLKFSPHGRNQTLVTDIVDYELPFGFLGHLLDDMIFHRDLHNILRARLQTAAKDLAQHTSSATAQKHQKTDESISESDNDKDM